MLAQFLALVLGVTTATAQATAVCSNTPTSSQRIECTEDANSTADIDIDTSSVTISTTQMDEPGIKATHAGTGKIDVDLTGGSITTTGGTSQGVRLKHSATGAIELDINGTSISTVGHGIDAEHAGTGDMTLEVEDGGVNMTTTGDGIFANHRGTGDLTLKVKGISGANTINTSGGGAIGIHGQQIGKGSVDLTVTDVNITTTGGGSAGGLRVMQSLSFKDIPPYDDVYNVKIDVHGSQISTQGHSGHGIYGLHQGKKTQGNIVINEGDLEITTTNTNIMTAGERASGIDAKSEVSNGDAIINMTGGSITTTGLGARGIRVDNGSEQSGEEGDVIVTVMDAEIETTHEADPDTVPSNYGIEGHVTTGGEGHVDITLLNTTITTQGHGVYGKRLHTTPNPPGIGNVDIDVTGGSITTKGVTASGIRAEHWNIGNIFLKQRNHAITTEATHHLVGTNRTLSHGIYATHEGTGDIDIDLERGSSITTTGVLSTGINGNHKGSGDIIIDLSNARIDTQSTDLGDFNLTFSNGIYATHEGTGDIDIDARSGGSITTAGTFSYGIYGDHHGDGAVMIDTHPGHTVTTTGPNGHGIVAYQRSTTSDPRIIEVTVGGNVDASGADSQGVRVGVLDENGVAERVATLDAEGYRQQRVTVNGSVRGNAAGVFLANGGRVVIGPRGSITSESGIAILATGTVPEVADDPNTPDDEATPAIPPKLRVDLNLNGRRVAQAIGDDWIINDGGETTIAVNGTVLHDGETGVTGRTARNGAWNVRMRAEGVTVNRTDPLNWEITEPAADVIADRDFSTGDFNERRRPKPPPPPPPAPEPSVHMVDEAVFGGPGEPAGLLLEAGGEVYIGPEGSVGAESGIAILATGDAPDLLVDLNLNGRRVAEVLGDDWIINDGGGTTIVVNEVKLHDGMAGVVSDAVAHNGAWNVRIKEEGVIVTDRSDSDPANWTVTEPAAGVIADRDFSTADFTEARRPPPPPSVHRVDEPVFGGPGEPAGVLFDGEGEVYIGAMGSVGAESGIAILAMGDEPKLLVDLNLNGRRVAEVLGDDWIINDGGETTIVANEVTLHDGATGVTGRTAPNGAWNVTMREEGVTVTDRTDPDPANWTVTAPATGVVIDRDFSTEDFIETGRHSGPRFMEEYAPRAAVYEALPDFLLRLTGPGPNRKCRTAPAEPVWVRFAGGHGSYEADRSTTGATYDLDRFETEGGVSAALNERVRGWASVRHVWGVADATSPTGGGAIDVRGLGSSVGGAWRSATGAYAMGCFSYMTYDVDFATSEAGLLRAGVNGRAYTLDFETGLRFALTEQVQLTSRVWAVDSRVSVDSFTDAVEARVSFADADRITGGLGFVTDTTRSWGDGELVLRGSVDVERLLSGTATRVQVSGEQLSAVATENSLLFGLNGMYRRGRFTVGAEVAVRQELGSPDSEYASFLNLGIRF